MATEKQRERGRVRFLIYLFPGHASVTELFSIPEDFTRHLLAAAQAGDHTFNMWTFRGHLRTKV